MSITAGSFVKGPTGDPELGAIRVGLVTEVSTNNYSDGSSETFAQVAWLDLIQVPIDTLAPYTSGGSAPVTPAVPAKQVTSTTVDLAKSPVAPEATPEAATQTETGPETIGSDVPPEAQSDSVLADAPLPGSIGGSV